MRRFLILLLFCGSANAATQFYVVPGTDDVVLGPFCVPDVDGVEWAALDYDTSNLVITVTSPSLAPGSAFNYTGGDIDDGPNSATHGDPTTDAIEVDAISVGAFAGCVNLHFRDEVFDNGNEWVVAFSDGGSAIMDTAFSITGHLSQTQFQTLAQQGAAAALSGYGVPTLTNLTERTLTSGEYPTSSQIGSITETLQSVQENVQAANVHQLWSGTATGGSTTTLIDATLTQDDDWWNARTGIIVEGYPPRCVTDFDSSTDTLTFAPALPSAVESDNYKLIADNSCAPIVGGVTLQAGAVDSSALAADAVTEIAEEIAAIEIDGYTLACALATLLSEAAGTWNLGGNSVVYRDPSGSDTRIQATISSSARSSVTITCP